MPRKRRMLKSRVRLYHDHVACLRWCQLGCGIDWKKDEFGEGKDFDEQAAREEWARIREEFLARWIEKEPATRPWGWWRFEQHMTVKYEPPRDWQHKWLKQHSELTEHEARWLKQYEREKAEEAQQKRESEPRWRGGSDAA